jgi:hypothetical protein
MTGERKASWGHWSLTLWVETPAPMVFHNVYFQVGPQGPQDGFLGSPERQRYEAIVKEWVCGGVLPMGVSTCCV